MSDNWLQYVPKDPTFRPTVDAAAWAQSLLQEWVPEAESVEFEFHEQTAFFEGGANWSGVQCPACGVDAETWWDAAMDAAGETGFVELRLAAPCCGSRVSLNDLKYGWPAGFASFSLEAMNPNSRGLSEEQLAQFEGILGCELREIPLHI